jgi:hypothetical protein
LISTEAWPVSFLPVKSHQAIMGKDAASQDTGMLQLESLQLDIQMLQKYREEDKTEFNDFVIVV